MSATPTGRLVSTDRGRDLVLTRSFAAGIDEVWASITESERTAKWFGPWTGEAAPGKTVSLTMAFEEGASASEVKIEECVPPSRLVVSVLDAFGSWLLEVELSESDGTTELRFTHHLDESADPGSVGPGWEYYLDKLVAARNDAPQPEWDDYYPAQKSYYER